MASKSFKRDALVIALGYNTKKILLGKKHGHGIIRAMDIHYHHNDSTDVVKVVVTLSGNKLILGDYTCIEDLQAASEEIATWALMVYVPESNDRYGQNLRTKWAKSGGKSISSYNR